MPDITATPSGRIGRNSAARFHADSSDPTPHPLTVLGDRIDPNGSGGCWLWTGGVDAAGYGVHQAYMSGLSGGTKMVHRIVYQILVGEIPEGYHLHHRCGVRACVNPQHLEPMSPSEHSHHHADLRRST